MWTLLSRCQHVLLGLHAEDTSHGLRPTPAQPRPGWVTLADPICKGGCTHRFWGEDSSLAFRGTWSILRHPPGSERVSSRGDLA